MKSTISILMLLILSGAAGFAASLTEQDLPDPPRGAWLRIQPTETDWPRKTFQNGIITNMGGFDLRIPSPRRLLMLGDSLTVYARRLKIQIQRVGAMQITFGAAKLKKVFTRSRFSVAEYPRLIFYATDSIPNGASLSDRWIMLSAMAVKSLLIRSGAKLYTTRKSCLTIFYSTLPEKRHDWLVMASDRRESHAYLAVHLFNARENDVRQFIAGMDAGGCKN